MRNPVFRGSVDKYSAKLLGSPLEPRLERKYMDCVSSVFAEEKSFKEVSVSSGKPFVIDYQLCSYRSGWIRLSSRSLAPPL